MATEHTATCCIVIGGLEVDACVVFEVESYGSPDTYFEPGDPASIVINDVRLGDEDGRSIYDLCEQTRDLWAKPRYASGYFQINSGEPRLNIYWREGDNLPKIYPAWCRIGFNASHGAFHSLLDTLYETVLERHMPDDHDYYDYDPRDD